MDLFFRASTELYSVTLAIQGKSRIFVLQDKLTGMAFTARTLRTLEKNLNRERGTVLFKELWECKDMDADKFASITMPGTVILRRKHIRLVFVHPDTWTVGVPGYLAEGVDIRDKDRSAVIHKLMNMMPGKTPLFTRDITDLRTALRLLYPDVDFDNTKEEKDNEPT
jgi:hypothetical protein